MLQRKRSKDIVYTIDINLQERKADSPRGKEPPISFNLAATRHLILRMQAILLAVPSRDGGRDAMWLERKEKCDALLSVCNSLAPLQSYSHEN